MRVASTLRIFRAMTVVLCLLGLEGALVTAPAPDALPGRDAGHGGPAFVSFDQLAAAHWR